MSDLETAVDGAEAATPAPTEPVAQASTQEPATAQGDANDPTPARDDKGRFVPQERVNEITRARRQAERELMAERETRQRLEAELSKYQRPPMDPNDRPPVYTDFNDPVAHAEALTAYVERRMEARSQHTANQARQQTVEQSFEARSREFAATHPDYDAKLDDLTRTVQFNPATVEVIGLSERGPEIVYHLAQNLDVADRIARMPPHLAAAEVARIEAKLSAPKPQQTTNAPAPVPVLGGSSSAATKDPAKMSYAEYKKYRMGG